jgi:hypothetical protein
LIPATPRSPAGVRFEERAGKFSLEELAKPGAERGRAELGKQTALVDAGRMVAQDADQGDQKGLQRFRQIAVEMKHPPAFGGVA